MGESNCQKQARGIFLEAKVQGYVGYKQMF